MTKTPLHKASRFYLMRWLLLVCWLLPVWVKATTLSEITSPQVLEQQLENATDANRASLLAKLAWLYRNNNYQQSISYALEAQKLLETFSDDKLNVQLLHTMAWAHMRAGDYVKAVELASQARTMAEEVNDQLGLAYSLNVLGSIEWFKGNFLNSLDYFLKTLEIRLTLDNKLDTARSYNNLGSVYQEIGEFDKARHYHTQSLALMEQLEYEYGIATSYFNLGVIHQRMGEEEQEEYFLEKALRAFTLLDDKAALSEVRINLGHLKLRQAKLDEAKTNFDISRNDAAQLKNLSLLARAELGQAEIAFRHGKLEEAQNLTLESLQLAEQLQEKTQLRDSNQLLASIYQTQGNFELALQAFKRHHEVRDSILQNVHQGNISLLQQKFDAQQAKIRIEFLEKEKLLGELRTKQAEREASLLTIGLALGLVLIAIILFQYYKLLKKNRISYYQSITDNLSGCFNRYYLFGEILRGIIEKQQKVYALLIDLDKFKRVNDEYGHDIGDELLIAFVARVKNLLDDKSYLVRLGGEEFAIVGQGKTRDEFLTLANKIQTKTSARVFQLGKNLQLPISCSIGVAFEKVASKTELIKLLKNADKAMYQAKNEGRDRVVSSFRATETSIPLANTTTQ